jgi:hypothetical protein
MRIMSYYWQPASSQQPTRQDARQYYLYHAALSDHFERQKIIYASNSAAYYRFAELEHFHKSRAYYYKGFFPAI